MSQANHTWDEIKHSPDSNMKMCSKMQLFDKDFKASQLIAKSLTHKCAWNVAQWYSACLACRRPGVQSLILTFKKEINLPGNIECYCSSWGWWRLDGKIGSSRSARLWSNFKPGHFGKILFKNKKGCFKGQGCSLVVKHLPPIPSTANTG